MVAQTGQLRRTVCASSLDNVAFHKVSLEFNDRRSKRHRRTTQKNTISPPDTIGGDNIFNVFNILLFESKKNFATKSRPGYFFQKRFIFLPKRYFCFGRFHNNLLKVSSTHKTSKEKGEIIFLRPQSVENASFSISLK